MATLPLKDTLPGPLTLSIKQFGMKDLKTLGVASFSEAGKYDTFTLHAGDRRGVLSGTRLDEVASLELRDVKFAPGKLTRNGNTDQLELAAAGDASAAGGKPATAGAPAGAGVAGLSAGAHSIAQLTLKDGRVVPVTVTVEDPRPVVTMINMSVQPGPAPQPAPPVAMTLGAPNEVPLDGKLTFALKSQTPATFSKGESIEIATDDGLSSVTFSLASGELVLQDAKTAIGTLDPAKSFSPSAFGPLHLRPILADGTTGDWVPVATLVRLPHLESYTCPPDSTQSCTLWGSGLFLLDSIAADQQFSKPVTVPDGFASGSIEVPRASNGKLYVKLRDDTAVVNTVTVPTAMARVSMHHVHPAPGASGAPKAPDESAPGVAPAGAAGTGAAAAPGSPGAPEAAPATGSPVPASSTPAGPPGPSRSARR